MKKKSFVNRSAIVCGASEGIGRETAREIVRRGGSVCILGRREEPLQTTAEELRGMIREEDRFADAIACDATDMERVKPALTGFVERRGVPDYLINVVGYAAPQYVEKLALPDFRRCMEANYFGQLIPTLVLLPHFMKKRRGHIAFVSSMMGYFGIMGYAAYAPSKFAVAGLAEALRHELKPYNIQFSVLYPPDTKTPGFAAENRNKPRECASMSEAVKVMSAPAVAAALVDGLLRKKYAIFPGESGVVWRLNRYFPALVRWVTDHRYEQARQKLGKTP